MGNGEGRYGGRLGGERNEDGEGGGLEDEESRGGDDMSHIMMGQGHGVRWNEEGKGLWAVMRMEV